MGEAGTRTYTKEKALKIQLAGGAASTGTALN